MYCRNCGNQIDNKAVMCPYCGAATGNPWPGQPSQPGWPQAPVYQGTPAPKVGFLEAVKLFFLRYADFKGRSRRSEYWWISLFAGLVIIPLYILLIIAAVQESEVFMGVIGILMMVFLLGTFIPNLAVTVRRLHDTGRSGWWYLLSFIPSVGSTIILVFCCLDSEPDNQWGPNPKFLH